VSYPLESWDPLDRADANWMYSQPRNCKTYFIPKYTFEISFSIYFSSIERLHCKFTFNSQKNKGLNYPMKEISYYSFCRIGANIVSRKEEVQILLFRLLTFFYHHHCIPCTNDILLGTFINSADTIYVHLRNLSSLACGNLVFLT